jgi:integrase
MLQKTPKAQVNSKPEIVNNKQVALMDPGRHRVDGEPGLYLYVSPDEQIRRWIFRYTSPVTNRVTETGLDMAAHVSLSQAKSKAQDLRKQIANGICPIHAKRTERASVVTFREACDGWIATHKSSWKGGDNSSQMNSVRVLLYDHGKALAPVPVTNITPDLIQSTLEKLWSKYPNQARRALAMFERVLDYARAKGMRTGDNPASWRGMHQYRFARARKIDRKHYSALPYEQMPSFMRELRQRQERSRGAVALEFTILTACRSGETYGAQWLEIDWDKKLWTIPKERTKQGREHTVPLSDRVMEILALQKKYANGSKFIFCGYKRTRLADKTMFNVLNNMKLPATVHGFRSSFRDFCGNETDFAREHVEETLGHAIGGAVERAYRRQAALDKRREILQAWSVYCTGRFSLK